MAIPVGQKKKKSEAKGHVNFGNEQIVWKELGEAHVLGVTAPDHLTP